LRRWLYRISATRKWNPVHPSQRFNFPRDNPRTVYLGQDLAVCRIEVLGRMAGLVPLGIFGAKARVDVVLWDLRKPVVEVGKTLGRLVQRKKHSWAVKALATRARRMGMEGVVYRSVQDPRKWCVVVFQENVAPRKLQRGRWRPLP